MILVFMYLLYFGIYRAGYSLLTDEISKRLYTRTSSLSDTLEKEVQRIQKLQNECLNDDTLYYTIGAFSIMSKSEQTKGLLEIQNRLKVLHESSTYIDEVIVSISGMNRKISSVKGVEIISGDEQELSFLQEKSKDSSIFYHEGEMYLGTVYPYNAVNPNAEPKFVLIIRLSKNKMKETLDSMNEYTGSGIKLADCNGEYELNTDQNINLDGFESTEQQSFRRMTDQSNSQEYLVFKIHSVFLNMDLYAYISDKTVYRDLYIYRGFFLACLTIVLIIMVGYISSIYKVIRKPINTLVETIEQMEKGDLSVRISEKREDEFGHVYVAFNRMAESLQNQMEINYKQKLLMQQAELRHLQSQINPHFLYNSFYSIYYMAKNEDSESVMELSSYLSEYYRYITKNARSDTKLSEEVRHARRYAQIQEMRFRRRLKVEFENLPEKFENIQVPRLILQPLLENSFEHGLNNVETGGILRVWYEEKEEKLFIHVQDNGAGMTEQELDALRESLCRASDEIEDGLCNINRRLKIKFGECFGIVLDAKEGEGALCSLILPLDDQDRGDGNV